MNTKQKKDVLIVVMSVALVFMGVAFAMLSQQLDVKGTITTTGSWDVQITDIQLAATQGSGESGSVSEDGTTASISAELSEPGDSVTYTVTVENKGSIDAKLDSINSVFTPTPGSAENPYITYAYSGIKAGDVLVAGDSVTFNVEIAYELDVTEYKEFTTVLTTTLNYVQNVKTTN